MESNRELAERLLGAAAQSPSGQEILNATLKVADTLLQKNRAYGDSALDPVRVFSKANTEEQIRVRMDDKLSRLARGNADGEDVELDLMGYIVLMRIARARNAG